MLSELKTRLGGTVIAWREKSQKRHYVEVSPVDIVAVTGIMFKDMGARFQIATGADTRDAIEVLYHWAFDTYGCVVTIVVRLDRANPELDSISGLCKGAEWIEREMWELLGIKFRNHPDMRHLLLSDDWPEGKFPLRKDYSRAN